MAQLTSADVRKLKMTDLGTGKMRHRINLLGVGGVGTNVLRQAARNVGCERLMFRTWDHDTVELHNLNRTTMFHMAEIGHKKGRAVASALKHLVAEEVAPKNVLNLLKNAYHSQTDKYTEFPIGMIVDCRDTLDVTKISPKTWIKLAYDGGTNISFTWRPDIVAARVFSLDDTNSYAVVPSFYVPAALLGVMMYRFMCFHNFVNITELKAGTFHMDIDEMATELSYKWEPEDREEVADGNEENSNE